MSSPTLQAIERDAAARPRWSQVKRERRAARRAEERTGGSAIDRPRDRINAVLHRLPSVRELTPTQKHVLLWLSEAILVSGGSVIQGQGELAAELNCSRRSIIRAVARFRQLELLESVSMKQPRTGGNDKHRYRLPRWLFLLFLTPESPETRLSTGCDKMSPPYPKGTDRGTSRLPARTATARANGAASPPERLYGALARSLTALIGDADRRVLLQVSRTCPESHYGAALRLAEWISHPDQHWIRAPGAMLRQKLAAELVASELPVPEPWGIDAKPADVRRARNRLEGPRAKPPARRARGARAAPVPISDLVGAIVTESSTRAENRPSESLQEQRSPGHPGDSTPQNPALERFAADWRAALKSEN